MLTEQQKAALRQIAAAAVESERATGCPAELTVAQCILESGWLRRAPGNNPFGIKRAARHQKFQTFMTTEFIGGQKVKKPLQFAAYDSLAEAFSDHAGIITRGRPYARAWAQYQLDRDVEALARGIAGVYATDPSYAEKVLSFVRHPEVRLAVSDARGPRVA